jgi:ribosomal protein S13
LFINLNKFFKDRKRVFILLSIPGIGFCKMNKILNMFGLNKKTCNLKVFKNIINNNKSNYYYLLQNDFLKIYDIYNNLKIIKNERLKSIFNLYKKISHYKGKRLIYNLPLNGQRTKTNASTIRKMILL